MTTSANFQIYYDGPALESGEMDIKDLAPSLLALGELFNSTNQILNGERATISVRVKTGFIKGSFGVDLSLFQSMAASLKGLFGDDPIKDIATLTAAIVGSGGIIQLLKKTKGEKPKEVTIKGDGNAYLEFGDNAKNITINQNVLTLYQDLDTRKAIEKFARPVMADGIEKIKIAEDSKFQDLIDHDDFDSFLIPVIEEEFIRHEEQATLLSIHTIVFGGENKWRLSQGTSIDWYKIEDAAFLAKVENRTSSFSKGDILHVKIRKSLWRTSEGLRSENAVIEVLKHEHTARQIPLNFSKPKR